MLTQNAKAQPNCVDYGPFTRKRVEREGRQYLSLLYELKSHFRRKLFAFLFPGQDWHDLQRWLQQKKCAGKPELSAVQSPAQMVRSQPDKFHLASDVFLMDSFRVDFFTPGHKTQPALVIGNRSMLYNTFQFESVTGSAVMGARCFMLPTTVVRLGPGLGYAGPNLQMGDDVFMGACCIYDNNAHSVDIHQRIRDLLVAEADYLATGSGAVNKDWSVVPMAPIRVEDHVWVGQDAVILKGVTLGKGSIVGAFSVVTRDVEAWTVVAGNPARVVRRLTPQC